MTSQNRLLALGAAMFRADASDDWRRFGDIDPYFGVLSSDRYRKEVMGAGEKAEFFDTGRRHVARVLAVLRDELGFEPGGRCLDFGCGVGRLALALGPHFSEVVGLDIAPGMIQEARRNSGAPNIRYESSEDPRFLTPDSYDFVHSYIVLQHIPTPTGYLLIDQLVRAVRPGGAGAIHFTYANLDGPLSNAAKRAIKEITPLRLLANRLSGRPWNYPAMQMNHYDIGRVVELMSSSGVRKFTAHRVDDWGHLGLFVFFRRADVADADPWSNPRRGVVSPN